MKNRGFILVLSILLLCPFVLGNTIESSTMVFQGALTPSGDGYEGVIPMLENDGYGDSGFDVFAKNGDTAYFSEDSDVVISDHDAFLPNPTWDPDTPDWYQYSLEFDGSNWALRNHAGATEDHPWYESGYVKIARGVPMSGIVNWGAMYAAETDVGEYISGTGTPKTDDSLGGAQAWDMDWSWGSEYVPLEYPGFEVIIEDLGGGDYKVTLTPAEGPVKNLNTGITYGTIQSAIDDASNGDVIEVHDGTYNENIVIDKPLTLQAGSSPIIVGGEGTIVSINSDDVTIDGFTITNNHISGTGIYSADHSDLTITNNNVTAIGNGSDDVFAQGVVIVSSSSDVDKVTITNNVIYDITSGLRTGSSSTSSKGIAIGWSNGDKDITKLLIQNNLIFDIDADTSPWNSPGTKGQGANGILINHGSNGDGQVISAKILGNNISDLEGLWAHAIGLEGDTPQALVQGNKIDDLTDHKTPSDAVAVMVEDNPSAGNAKINYNSFTNLNVGVYKTSSSTGVVDARFNYWDSCDGPGLNATGSGVNVSNDVTFEPWLGICFTDKKNQTCVFETTDVTLEADAIVNSTGTISSVWFSYVINGVNYTKPATPFLTNRYMATIPSSELVGGRNVTWNIYAEDGFGNVYSDGWNPFYVINNTNIFVDPETPDGDVSWYVTEPEFSFEKDSNITGDVYYQWDSVGEGMIYNFPFGLEDAPNNGNTTAGILELKWWANFSGACIEPVQSETFYIDLTNPVIKNLVPANGSTVYNPRPLIEAYLDELYQSNSGINKASVIMKLDGVIKTADINDADTIDSIVQYKPMTDLPDDGMHNVSIYVEDNAGRISEKTWFFYINTSISPFELTINSPQEGDIFGSRRVLLDLMTSEKSDEIEYIDYADRNPRWRRLCINCDEYDREKSFTDGRHNITIRAENSFGQVVEKNISFFIDSRAPRISRTEPRRNLAVNGSEFYIKYTEDNLKNITLFYGLGTESITKTDCEAGSNMECYFQNVDLTEYEGRYIEYWFEVSDAVNTVESRKTRVFVDTIAPEIEINLPQNYGNYGRKVPVNISVSEDVLLEYIDYADSNPRWRRFCSNCDEYGLSREKVKSFREGIHYLTIRATDKAGNTDTEEVSFEVNY